MPVDRLQAVPLPVSDGVLVNAKSIGQFVSSVERMNLDPVWVRASGAHLDVNAKSRSDLR